MKAGEMLAVAGAVRSYILKSLMFETFACSMAVAGITWMVMARIWGVAMSVPVVAMFSVAVAQITVGFFALDLLKLGLGNAANAAGIAWAAGSRSCV